MTRGTADNTIVTTTRDTADNTTEGKTRNAADNTSARMTRDTSSNTTDLLKRRFLKAKVLNLLTTYLIWKNYYGKVLVES